MTQAKPSGGWLRENPVAAMLVGLCPAAAVTGRVIDALWMSLGMAFVLILTSLSRVILHLLLDAPGSAGSGSRESGLLGSRWLGVLFLAACFTASFEVIMGAFAPQESAALGIYVPLLAVNCIVLERLADGSPRRAIQENGARIFRALGAAASRGAAFAVALVLISVVRETLGSGTITLFPLGAFGGTIVVSGISAAPARALLFAGGGFLCLGYLAGLVRLAGRLRNRRPRAAGEAGAQ